MYIVYALTSLSIDWCDNFHHFRWTVVSTQYLVLLKTHSNSFKFSRSWNNFTDSDSSDPKLLRLLDFDSESLRTHIHTPNLPPPPLTYLLPISLHNLHTTVVPIRQQRPAALSVSVDDETRDNRQKNKASLWCWWWCGGSV